MLVLEPVLVSPWGKSLQISGALGWTRNFHEFSGFCLLPGVVCGLTLGNCISEHRRINACLKTSSGVRLESCLQLDLGYLGIKKTDQRSFFYIFLKFFVSFAEDKPGQMDRVVDPNGVGHALKVARLPAQDARWQQTKRNYFILLYSCIYIYIHIDYTIISIINIYIYIYIHAYTIFLFKMIHI